jgi:hypothetical protein
MLVVSFLSSVYFSYNAIYSQTRIDSLSHLLVNEKKTDKERVLALLGYVSKLNTTDVHEVKLEEYKVMKPGRVFNSIFYRVLPINLIPSSIVLDYQLGACGAKSRLFCAMSRSVGYDCRLLNMPGHTLTEVRIDGIWTPLGPTYGTYFENDDGSFAPTERVKADFDFFSETVSRLNEEYPIDDPNYQFKGYSPSMVRRAKDALQNTTFYMRPNIFFSTISIIFFLGFLRAFYVCRKRLVSESRDGQGGAFRQLQGGR